MASDTIPMSAHGNEAHGRDNRPGILDSVHDGAPGLGVLNSLIWAMRSGRALLEVRTLPASWTN